MGGWDRGQVHVPELGHVPDPCPKPNHPVPMSLHSLIILPEIYSFL